MKLLKEYTKETILSEELFTEIFDQEDEIMKARMLLSCEERAKDLGVKTQFTNLVKAYNRVAKATQKKKAAEVSNTLLDRWTNFTGPYDNLACGAWIASDEGIRIFNKDYTNEVIVCYHPILPIQRMRNLETGVEQIKLAFRRNWKWKEVTVAKDLVSSASKIVALSKLGISVTSENAKLLVKYLSDLENLNEDAIEVVNSSSKLGWIGDGFLPYDASVVFDGDMQFRQVYDSIKQHGSEEEWMELVLQLRRSGRMEVKFMLAAAFASVLVEKAGALPFIVDLWGETEGGKTVALMLAASVWANPDIGQYIGDFKTTDVQLEVKADLLNHLPLLLDDSSKTSSRIRDNFEGVVYDLCSGKGKSRSNKDLGIRRENRWKNVIITNGERPLSSYVSQGGAINRILEVECKDYVFWDPQGTVDVLKKHYGHAGKRFVEIIQKMGSDAVKEIQKDFQRQIYQDDKMQKQSIALSLIMTADKIATDYIFCDREYIDIDQAKEVLVDHNELSEHERCYRYLLDKIQMNSQRFDMHSPVESWGLLEDDYAILYVQAFKDLCKAGGFSDKAFLSWADRNGVIQTGNGRMTKVKKINGQPVRCVFLKINEFEDENGFVSEEIYEQEELPFS